MLMFSYSVSKAEKAWTLPLLLIIFFISGFTALLYQVVWQRMLGLFLGSDVRSVTIVIASYLLGLGLGGLLGGMVSDRLSSRQSVQIYGFCNLGIAAFAVSSRLLFYDLLFRHLQPLAASTVLTLGIVLISLLIPTVLMGLSLPLLAKAISRGVDRAAAKIGLLYGVNTLGSGVGSLITGWYIIGTIGYDRTVELGAALSLGVGLIGLGLADRFETKDGVQSGAGKSVGWLSIDRPVLEWCVLVFFSGFAAISLEIIWFRVLDTVLQSIAYTYAHLLAFILISNALGSLIGSSLVQTIRQPRQTFLLILGSVVAYAAIAIGLISFYWQAYPPDLRVEIGYIDPDQINTALLLKYGILPLVMLVPPNLLLGAYFPLVQQAIQTDQRQIGQRVGLIQVANILGNTTGSLLTGLVLLNSLGTANSLRLLIVLGVVAVLLVRPSWLKAKQMAGLTIGLTATLAMLAIGFPNNTQLWAALHGVQPGSYFIVDEDSTGVAAITEANQQGTLFASGQAQASFPYLPIHALLGSLPALIHPDPVETMIIGLGSGGTAHTAGINPSTQQIQVIELLGSELTVLRQYAKTPVGRPLNALFQDPRYQFTVGDGRRELALTDRRFDIIEADAIYPWRSRAGMLYSQEFFQEVQTHLKPGGIFVEWNAGLGVEQTFRSVFPYVTQLATNGDLYLLMGSDRPIELNRETVLTQLNTPDVINFLIKAEVDVEAIRQAIRMAHLQTYSHDKDGRPEPFNTDLFPRSEYYLNQSSGNG